METGIIVVSLICFALIIRMYYLTKENMNLKSALIQDSYDSLEEDESIQKQFLKFVSDSREWAFEYIETVQKELSDIVDDMTPVIVNRENRNYNERDTLESVYKRLKDLLPEQDN